MTLKLCNLSAGYDRRPVVHHISGDFAAASMTAVVGPNGGGKSTLVKTLAGFIRPMTGRIDYGNIEPHRIAYLPQQFDIDRSFPINVMDVVLAGHWPRLGAWRRIRAAHREAAMRALAMVDMAAFAARPIISLSSGQWQRVLFARLSLQGATVLLLDEPFAAIDSRTTHDLLHILEQWRRDGCTIICVMHDFQLVREHFPQSLLVARDLIAWGDTGDVMRDENLARASALATRWVDHAEICDLHEGDAA